MPDPGDVTHEQSLDTDSPVRSAPVDADQGIADNAIGLGMSGGGYRATLFHLGALWRLNELGYLPKLTRISSVSGGSIASATLAVAWPKLDFDPATGTARAFAAEVAEPLRRLATHTIDKWAILVGSALPFVTISDRVESAYRKHLYGNATLADLPDPAQGHPQFVFNACSVQTGSLFRFERSYIGDWRIGLNRKAPSSIPIARAVAASSAFAPVLSPAVLEVDPADFEATPGATLSESPYTKRIVLTDGGNYDNLGLETIYKRCRTVLVSDASARLPFEGAPHEDWARHGVRAAEMLLNQIISLRKRQLLDAFKRPTNPHLGTYWSVRSEIASYTLADPVAFDPAFARELSETPTRLATLPTRTINGLINWGYAICDTAIRKHVEPSALRPTRLPYAAGG